jgi:hypothetical protein
MVTGRASNTRREGSIPSRPARLACTHVAVDRDRSSKGECLACTQAMRVAAWGPTHAARLRRRVSPIPPPQRSRGRAPENADAGTAKSGAADLLRRAHPWAMFTGNATRGGVSSGLRMHRARSREGGAGKRVSQSGSLRVLSGFDSRCPLSSSRFSDEDRGLQNRARGFDSLSALHHHAPLAQRKGHRLLSDPFQVRLLGGAPHVPVI